MIGITRGRIEIRTALDIVSVPPLESPVPRNNYSHTYRLALHTNNMVLGPSQNLESN